jgi:predicted DNA-binding transcriptional regulator AlpA/ribosomal protein L28
MSLDSEFNVKSGRKLDGWKEIASYVGKSAKTVQRWEKEDGFPIERVPGKKSVFAFDYKIDQWLLNRSNELDFETSNQEKIAENVYVKSTLKYFLLFFIAVFGVFVLMFFFYGYWKKTDLQKRKLTSVVENNGKVLKVVDENGKVLKTFTSDWEEYRFFAYHPYGGNLIFFEDINNDNILDVIMPTTISNKKNLLRFFIADNKGNLVLERKLNMELTYIRSKTKEKFINFYVHNMCLHDIDKDGEKEIILVQNSHPFYPACVKVFKLNGKEIFRLYHPGRLHSIIVRDNNKNGKDEIILSGTNNYIHKLALPVVISLESNWNEFGKCLDLINYENSNCQIGKDISVIYMGFNCTNEEIQSYQTCMVHGRYPNLFQIDAFVDKKSSYEKMINGVYSFVRKWKSSFIIDNKYEVNSKYFLINYLRNHNLIDKDEKLLSDKYLKALYFNGKNWQTEKCNLNFFEKFVYCR